MQILEYHQQLARDLTAIYDQREANNIASIVLEEYLNESQISTSEQVLTDKQITDLESITSKLLKKTPWQYVFGRADFYGLKLYVNEHTLIPRPETEELVLLIKQSYQKKAKDLKILDIGTGSGCIAVTTKYLLPDAEVHALDKSVEALAIARQNADKYKTSIRFWEKDILDIEQCADLPKYNLIVSNPPYITHQEHELMGENVLAHEPDMALFVTNDDPLQFYKAIAIFAQIHLDSGGRIMAELNPAFSEDVKASWEQLGFVNCKIIKDIYGNDRIALGEKTGKHSQKLCLPIF